MGRGGTGWARFPGEINISILFIIIFIIKGIVIIVVVIIIVIFILCFSKRSTQGLHKDHLLILWPNKKQYKEE